MTDIRWDLVRHLREQIAAGTYETPAKLRVACNRIVEKLGETDPPPDSVDEPEGLCQSDFWP